MRKIVVDFEFGFEPEPYSQCWIWTGAMRNHGYGAIGDNLAHREFYQHYIGLIPDGMHLHHRCDTPLCVNPAHLQLIRPADHPVITWAGKTHCRNGHLRTDANTYRRPNGTRLCRECSLIVDRHRKLKPERREYNRRWNAAKKRKQKLGI
jgi:hypothetical protein